MISKRTRVYILSKPDVNDTVFALGRIFPERGNLYSKEIFITKPSNQVLRGNARSNANF